MDGSSKEKHTLFGVGKQQVTISFDGGRITSDAGLLAVREFERQLGILDAAVRAFETEGYDNASMDRIAEMANASKRTVYNHFPSKEVLFKAIARQFIEEMQQAISVEYDSQRPLDEQLGEIGKREVAQVTDAEYVAIFRVFLAEAASFSDFLDEVAAEASSGHDPVATWIRAAMDDGRLRAGDDKRAATQFTALLKGPLFWPLVAGYGKPASARERKAVIDAAVAMFLDHYAS